VFSEQRDLRRSSTDSGGSRRSSEGRDAFDLEGGLPTLKDDKADSGYDSDGNESQKSFYSAHSGGHRSCSGDEITMDAATSLKSLSSTCPQVMWSANKELGERLEAVGEEAASTAPSQRRRRSSVSAILGQSFFSRTNSNGGKSRNSNKVSQYCWLEELLQIIVDGSSRGAAIDIAAGARCSPVFVVAGACPNRLCGMQALVYACLDGGCEWSA
jgi:hypothetical protein